MNDLEMKQVTVFMNGSWITLLKNADLFNNYDFTDVDDTVWDTPTLMAKAAGLI